MVITTIEIALIISTIPLLLMSSVLLIEVTASTLFPSTAPGTRQMKDRLSVAVLIPAHDESAGIARTLSSLKSQLGSDDRLLVVADNCSDDTAIIARKLGAEVIERSNTCKSGKGYALSFGISHLKEAPRPVIIVIDADCTAGPGTIDVLSSAVSQFNRPVQSLNLIVVRDDAPLLQRVGAFAFRVKNWARFDGLQRLGLPCPLAGTGMAFPWPVIRDAKLATGNIVEDMKLGIDLAIANSPAMFEPQALVTSPPPEATEDQLAQRRRWEHGHIQTLIQELPRLVFQAFRQRRLDLLAMALDLFVVPLSMHAILTLVSLTISILIILLQGTPLPFVLSATTMVFLVMSVLMSWYTHGRDLLTAGELVKIPTYVVTKIPVYIALFFSRESKWKRTARIYEDDSNRS